ncbi:MAG: copper resistance system multicopper oxidase [Alphaproteobacteria bacterium]|nr:copper resistance system multicopper oxidase [Alphaproteobacteria bacterium]
MKHTAFLAFWLLAIASPFAASAKDYDLTISHQTLNITGKPLEKVVVNGILPAPTLRFKQGEEAVIHVTNRMDVPTSVHWHGLLVPGAMDGVDGLNGFSEIQPGQSFTYRFKLRQTGTYWYHSHTGGQEQEGLYGALIVDPAGRDPIKSDRDYIVMLNDYHDDTPSDIIGNLKKSSDYYANARRTVGDFFADIGKKGFDKAWKDEKDWGQMRMARTDLSDVTGYTFLTNGKTPEQNWTGLFKAGERVRLRFINASSMSFFDVRIPGLKMSVVQADGQNVESVGVDEFRFAPAETYDVIVTPKDDKAYTVVAEPIDRTGFALGTLAPHEGMKGEMPTHRPRTQLKMGDMSMEEMGDMVMTPADMKSAWGDAATPKGDKALQYSDLRYAGIQKDVREPNRTIDVTLGGNMERYIWTLNGKQMQESKPIRLKYGERVRLTFTNNTMMAHPMHLHGMFVQLENGQPMAKLPNKHTVIIQPGKSYSVLLTADEVGEWSFHCHLLYHMMSGMMTTLTVAKLDTADMPQNVTKTGAHHEH